MSTWGWKQNALISVNLEKGTYTLNPDGSVVAVVGAFETVIFGTE